MSLPTFQTLEFTVRQRKVLLSQAARRYARLATDEGTVIVFQNTLGLFEEGGRYRAGGIWEEKNGERSFVVTCPASEVVSQSKVIPSKQKSI